MAHWQESPRWQVARGLVLLDAEDVDLIVEIVQQSEAVTAAEFTGFVWAVAPVRGRREAAARSRDGNRRRGRGSSTRRAASSTGSSIGSMPPRSALPNGLARRRGE